MNKEIQTEWTAALRSGKYKQGTGYLRTGDGFCCLGVLCDVLSKKDPEKYGQWTESLNPKNFRFQGPGEWNVAWLPPEVREMADFSRTQENELGQRNDDGHTFEEIAKFIETF